MKKLSATAALCALLILLPGSLARASEILSGSAGIPAESFKHVVYQQPEPAEPEAEVDLTVEFGRRELQSFHDSAYSRSASRFFYDNSPTLNTRAITVGITVDRGTGPADGFPSRWRLEGRYFDGDAHDQSSIFIQSQTTDTISIDGAQPQPSIFSISTYDIDVDVKERGGEGLFLGEILRRPTSRGRLSLSLGPKVGYRRQDWSVDYLGTYRGTNPVLFGRQAVHFVREELSTPYAGIAGRLAWREQMTRRMQANISIDASAFGQFSSLSGTDCFSIRFGAPICDGLHHGRGVFEYRSKLDETSTRIGAQLRLAGKLSWKFPLGSTQGALHAGGYVEGHFNDAAIDNPNFYNPRPAQVKYDNVFGYGISVGGSLKF